MVYTSNDDAVAAQTAAAFYMIKAGAAPETTYALTGRLYVTSENWALLSVPNAVVRGLFDAMSEPGIELPPGRPNFNAHITVLRPTDIELIGGAAKVTERGHSFKYQLGPVTTIEPTGWKDVSRCWMVQIRSPELEAFRKSYGLSALPAGDHPFHLTIAVRKKNVLRPNTVSKAASETLRPHYKEARLISLADLDEAAARAHQSPSDAQKDAGNYAKGHVSIHGMPVSIEVAKGNMRSGVTKDGRAWSVTMPAHYGYFKGTVGSDGDHVDVFIGEHPESGFVLVVNQVDPETRTFDEHKVIVGTRNAAEAKALYLSGYEKGWKGMGATTTMTVDQLRAWLTKGNTKKPVKPLTVKTADSSSCPKCGGSSDVYCRCQMTHRDYACGYDWHTCSIHGPGSPGTGKGKDPNKCTCDAQKKRASADLCPVCGEEHVMTCRCRLGNKRCANNHEWHNCAVHGPGSPGSGHGKGTVFGACSCDVTEKGAALAATFTTNKTYDAICPHCKEVIREKSTLLDPETGLTWHRPCRDKAPFEINWPSQEKQSSVAVDLLGQLLEKTAAYPDPRRKRQPGFPVLPMAAGLGAAVGSVALTNKAHQLKSQLQFHPAAADALAQSANNIYQSKTPAEAVSHYTGDFPQALNMPIYGKKTPFNIMQDMRTEGTPIREAMPEGLRKSELFNNTFAGRASTRAHYTGFARGPVSALKTLTREIIGQGNAENIVDSAAAARASAAAQAARLVHDKGGTEDEFRDLYGKLIGKSLVPFNASYEQRFLGESAPAVDAIRHGTGGKDPREFMPHQLDQLRQARTGYQQFASTIEKGMSPENGIGAYFNQSRDIFNRGTDTGDDSAMDTLAKSLSNVDQVRNAVSRPTARLVGSNAAMATPAVTGAAAAIPPVSAIQAMPLRDRLLSQLAATPGAASPDMKSQASAVHDVMTTTPEGQLTGLAISRHGGLPLNQAGWYYNQLGNVGAAPGRLANWVSNNSTPIKAVGIGAGVGLAGLALRNWLQSREDAKRQRQPRPGA